MASSLPFVCYNETVGTLREMAQQNRFVAQGEDRIKPVNEKSVLGRFGRRDPALDGKERNISMPGFTVTYLGMSGGPSQGSLCHDERLVRILVQLIDNTDGTARKNAETYFYWMTLVREYLQANPYDAETGDAGQVSLVHVTEEPLLDEESWAIDRQVRMQALVNFFVHMRRTKDQERWQ